MTQVTGGCLAGFEVLASANLAALLLQQSGAFAQVGKAGFRRESAGCGRFAIVDKANEPALFRADSSLSYILHGATGFQAACTFERNVSMRDLRSVD